MPAEICVDVSRDPKIERIFTELAEASIKRLQQYKWPVDQLYCAVICQTSTRSGSSAERGAASDDQATREPEIPRMSLSNSSTFSMRQWWIALQPPRVGYAGWAWFSKSPRWYPRDDPWGALAFPLFSTKEEADAAFAENGFDPSEYRVVAVKVAISEVSEEEAREGGWMTTYACD